MMVGQNEFDVGVPFQHLQRLDPRPRLAHLELLGFQKFDERASGGNHVIDDQNPGSAVRDRAAHGGDQVVERELVILDDVVDDVTRCDPVAHVDIERRREDDGGDILRKDLVKRLAIPGARQIKANDRHGETVRRILERRVERLLRRAMRHRQPEFRLETV